MTLISVINLTLPPGWKSNPIVQQTGDMRENANVDDIVVMAVWGKRPEKEKVKEKGTTKQKGQRQDSCVYGVADQPIFASAKGHSQEK